MSKLDPEFKAKWCAALRSGEYEQGKECLRPKSDCFCCLGVASDLIHGRSAWAFERGIWTIEGEDLMAPTSLVEIGLSEEASNCLANMNDTGASFSEIADYIEKHL